MTNENLSSDNLNNVNNMFLTINDFGPINHADIKINKINVIAGKNSTGKSSASKLLYCFLRANASDRQIYALESIRGEIYELFNSIREASFFDSDTFDSFQALRSLGHIKSARRDIDVDADIAKFYKFKKEFEDYTNKINDSFSKISILNQFNTVERLIKIIDDNSNDLFDQLMENLIASEFSVYNPKKIEEINRRDLRFSPRRTKRNIMRIASELDDLIRFLNSNPNLKHILTEEDIQKIRNTLEGESSGNSDEDFEEQYKEPSQFAILSNSSCELQYKIDFTNFLFDYAEWLMIDNVYYLDSFSIFDHRSSIMGLELEHANQLRRIFGMPKQKRLFDSILHEKIINIENKINEIIGGNFSFKGGIKFNLGEESFEMKNTASGIKQIGLIQMLLEKRVLNENSFLIIDEPEVNLHPEWQVKFAEILVLLAKDLGVTLYINSHSPMFIEAMDTFAEHYDFEDFANYYLSIISEEENKFDFIEVDSDELYLIYDNLGDPYDYLDRVRLSNSRKEGDDDSKF